MSDNDLINYIKKVETNFNSHVEKGTIEMSLEYYNLCEELIARGINAIQENQQLKEEKQELIDYLKEQINERKLTGNDEDYIKLDVYEEILSKIEKSDK